MKKILCLLLLVALYQKREDILDLFKEKPVRNSTYQSTRWYQDAERFSASVQESNTTGAAHLVYFYTDWCPYCKRLDNDIIYTAKTRENLQDVVRIRINPDADAASRKIAQQFGINGFPIVLVKYPDMQDYSQVGIQFDEKRFFVKSSNGTSKHFDYTPDGFEAAVNSVGL